MSDWLVMAGADVDVLDSPVSWLAPAEPARALPAALSKAEATAGMQVARPVAAPLLDLSGVATLDALREAVHAFDGCPYRHPSMNTVFADGNPLSRVMLIGEAPGQEEDLRGLPFVGRAGQLLDRMLGAIGRDRTSAYITNITFWRPPQNRTPTPAEVAATRPFLLRHIALVDPVAILALGAPAAKALLEVEDGITRLRGKWREIEVGGRCIPVLPTFHPAYLLRQPGQKRLSWHDLQMFRDRVSEAGL